MPSCVLRCAELTCRRGRLCWPHSPQGRPHVRGRARRRPRPPRPEAVRVQGGPEARRALRQPPGLPPDAVVQAQASTSQSLLYSQMHNILFCLNRGSLYLCSASTRLLVSPGNPVQVRCSRSIQKSWLHMCFHLRSTFGSRCTGIVGEHFLRLDVVVEVANEMMRMRGIPNTWGSA